MRRPVVTFLAASVLAASALAASVSSLAPAAAALVPDRMPAASAPVAARTQPGGWFEPGADGGFTARIGGRRVDVRPEGVRLGGLALSWLGQEGPSLRLSGANRTPTKVSYLLGNDPARWRRGLPTYAAVEYAELWAGVDLRYDLTPALKGTYTVAAGAPVNRIAWRYDAARVALVGGALHVTPLDNRLSPVIEKPPVAWQDTERGRDPVDVRYEVRPDGAVGFTAGAYDPARPLVIDPEIEWTDLLQPTSFTVPSSSPANEALMTVDDAAAAPSGEVVVVGSFAESGVHPVTGHRLDADGYQQEYGGKNELWMARWAADGAIRWLTYLGGEGNDYPSAVAVGPAGRVVVVGTTFSTDFPTQHADQPSGDAAYDSYHSDGFATLLTADGQDAVFSTYISGASKDTATGVTFSRDGGMTVVGSTWCLDTDTDLMCDDPSDGRITATPGRASTAETAGYVRRYSEAGEQLWTATPTARRRPAATAQPGALTDIAVGDDGALYVSGYAEYDGLAGTPGAWQEAPSGGRDGFVLRMDGEARHVAWQTLVGGSARDEVWNIAVAPDDRVVVFGGTTSTDFPVQEPSGQTCAAAENGGLFVLRLDPDGRRATASTCLGGSGTERTRDNAAMIPVDGEAAHNGLDIDSEGNAYVAGFTDSDDVPWVAPWQERRGGSDALVAKLDSTGRIIWSSPHGGGEVTPPANEDTGAAIAALDDGAVVVVGMTRANDVPGTRPEDARTDDTYAAFVSRFRAEPRATATPTPTETATASVTWSARPSQGPTEEASASAAPTASATPSPSSAAASENTPSPSSPQPQTARCSTGELRVLDPQIVAGQRSRVRYHGTPGTSVVIDGYSRHAGQEPTYRPLRAAVTVPSSGVVDYAFAPTTNTRLRARDDCGPSESRVVNVAPALTLRVVRDGPRRYVITGGARGADDGRAITVLYRLNGREVRKAVAQVRHGRWSVRVQFTSSATVTLLARSAGDGVSAAGRSVPVRVAVR